MHTHHSEELTFWPTLVNVLIVGVVVGSAGHALLEGFEVAGGIALVVAAVVAAAVYVVMERIHRRTHQAAVLATGMLFLGFSTAHTLVDGLNLGAALSVSLLLALGNFLGLVLHEVARWFASAAFLQKLGWSNRAAWGTTVGLAVGMIGLTATVTHELVESIPYPELVAAAAAGGTLALVLPNVAPRMVQNSRRALSIGSFLATLFVAVLFFQLAAVSHAPGHNHTDDHPESGTLMDQEDHKRDDSEDHGEEEQ